MGVRGYVRRELYNFYRESGGHYFTSKQVRERGPEAILQQIGEILGNCDSVYVTIDIDVVDASLAHGTGAISFGGFTPQELLDSAHSLSVLNMDALDLVEVAPSWDPTGMTGRLAADVLVQGLAPRLFGRSSLTLRLRGPPSAW